MSFTRIMSAELYTVTGARPAAQITLSSKHKRSAA